jgi:PAS domain S-box-containing protein
MLLDLGGVIQEVNSRWREMFGCGPDESPIGRPYADLVPEESAAKVASMLQRVTCREAVACDGERRLRNGSLGYHTLHATPVIHGGAVVGADVFLADESPLRAAQQALAESELCDRRARDRVQDVLYAVSPEGKLVFLGGAYRRLLGISNRGDLYGKSVWELATQANVPWETVQRILRQYQDAVDEGRDVIVYECPLVVDGEQRFFEMKENLLYDAAGEPAGAYGVMRDITERKRAEDVIRWQRDLAFGLAAARDLIETLGLALRSAMELAAVESGAVYLLAVDGSAGLVVRENVSPRFSAQAACLDADSPLARLLARGAPLYAPDGQLCDGFEALDGNEEFPARAILPIRDQACAVVAALVLSSTSKQTLPPVVRPALEAMAAQIGASVDRIRAEEALQKAHRELEQRVERRTAQLADANRKLREEIAERERAVQELRRSEERFRVAFEEGPLGIVIIGRSGEFLHANRAFCQMLGYRIDELSEKTVYQVVHPDELDRISGLVARVQSPCTPRATSESRCLGRDGRVVSVRITVNRVRGAQGAVLYSLAIIEDITEQKRTEEALRRAERLASVGTLAAGIAHEINNPLGAILLSAEAASLARNGTKGEVILEASLANIRTSAMRCGRIVKSVLQFARDEISQKWPNSMGDVARQARDMTRKLAVERSVGVRLELGEDCPDLVMNPTEMEQVLMNLVTNAIQASEPQSEVVVRTRVEGDALRVTVIDHGRGMTQDELAHMFDPFFTSRTHEGGTGLGLSIAHGIVQDHGGTIEVESRPGQGTSVTLVFSIELCKLEGASHG